MTQAYAEQTRQNQTVYIHHNVLHTLWSTYCKHSLHSTNVELNMGYNFVLRLDS
jgi:hypothetical protein